MGDFTTFYASLWNLWFRFVHGRSEVLYLMRAMLLKTFVMLNLSLGIYTNIKSFLSTDYLNTFFSNHLTIEVSVTWYNQLFGISKIKTIDHSPRKLTRNELENEPRFFFRSANERLFYICSNPFLVRYRTTPYTLNTTWIIYSLEYTRSKNEY